MNIHEKQKNFILEDNPHKIINSNDLKSYDPFYFIKNTDILEGKPILEDRPYDKTEELVKKLIKR